jgi:hypothetical protein
MDELQLVDIVETRGGVSTVVSCIVVECIGAINVKLRGKNAKGGIGEVVADATIGIIEVKTLLIKQIADIVVRGDGSEAIHIVGKFLIGKFYKDYYYFGATGGRELGNG